MSAGLGSGWLGCAKGRWIRDRCPAGPRAPGTATATVTATGVINASVVFRSNVCTVKIYVKFVLYLRSSRIPIVRYSPTAQKVDDAYIRGLIIVYECGDATLRLFGYLDWWALVGKGLMGHALEARLGA